MRKLICSLLIALMLCAPAVAENENAAWIGHWYCSAVDMGDGEWMYDLYGMPLSDMMQMDLMEDGTLTVVSSGQQVEGSWARTETGATLTIGTSPAEVTMVDGQISLREESGDAYTILLFTCGETPASKIDLSAYSWNGEYAGAWKGVAIDLGTGSLLDNLAGMTPEEMMGLEINADGTAKFILFEVENEAKWEAVEGGIRLTTANDQQHSFTMEGNCLVYAEFNAAEDTDTIPMRLYLAQTESESAEE